MGADDQGLYDYYTTYPKISSILILNAFLEKCVTFSCEIPS